MQHIILFGFCSFARPIWNVPIGFHFHIYILLVWFSFLFVRCVAIFFLMFSVCLSSFVAGLKTRDFLPSCFVQYVLVDCSPNMYHQVLFVPSHCRSISGPCFFVFGRPEQLQLEFATRGRCCCCCCCCFC